MLRGLPAQGGFEAAYYGQSCKLLTATLYASVPLRAAAQETVSCLIVNLGCKCDNMAETKADKAILPVLATITGASRAGVETEAAQYR